jgi:hypothetical protein
MFVLDKFSEPSLMSVYMGKSLLQMGSSDGSTKVSNFNFKYKTRLERLARQTH